ncbi:hypothetical protein ACFPYJ_31245 [Paenibacillus solisilvae]|uniref:DUF1275 domain-containing protein n=1 Tax=Paenibacillus solisilvae TaxID=2486751 RepID=A0ABW0W5N2_9BACL
MFEFLGYMFFSTIEGFAVYALILYIFRYDLKRFFWHALLMIELVNLQSYITREELSISYISPILSLVTVMLFLTTIARIPIIWSMIISALGYAAFALLQSVIVFASFGFLSINEVQTVAYKGYLLQTLTGAIGTFIGYKIYKLGYGFTFEFEKQQRYKWEKPLIIILMVIFFISIGSMLYFKDFYLNSILLVVLLIIFLYYSIRKEQEPIR